MPLRDNPWIEGEATQRVKLGDGLLGGKSRREVDYDMDKEGGAVTGLGKIERAGTGRVTC